jgi:hypothetical protein
MFQLSQHVIDFLHAPLKIAECFTEVLMTTDTHTHTHAHPHTHTHTRTRAPEHAFFPLLSLRSLYHGCNKTCIQTRIQVGICTQLQWTEAVGTVFRELLLMAVAKAKIIHIFMTCNVTEIALIICISEKRLQIYN